MLVITEPKICCFNFDFPQVENSLKDKIKFIIKHNESLAEYEMKNEITQLLSNYKHGNDFHDYSKEKND